MESHLKVAAGRLERVKLYACQLWNKAYAAERGGHGHE